MKTKSRPVLTALALLALLTFTVQLGTAFAAPTVTKVAGGFNHTLFLLSDGSLWGVGFNGFGQLGDGTTSNRYSPHEIVSSNVTAMAAGYEHTLFVKSDGSLWVIGGNDFGQLGDGATTNHLVPEEIVSSGVTAVAAGFYFSLFLKSDGSLWGMGYYTDGELGIGSSGSTTNLPVRIVAANVAQITAGDWHSLFITTDGSLWTMGLDTYGQQGDNSTLDTFLPEEVITNHSVFAGLTAVAGGGFHSLYLYDQVGSLGQLWAMGYNQYGELGNGGTNTSYVPFQIVASGVSAIAAGYYHSLFVKNDGSLWAMGENQFGQLGDATFTDTNTPQEILFSNVTAVAAGGYHSLFIKSDGSLWGMGDDQYGQLADSTLLGTTVPERIYPPRLLFIAGINLSGTNLIVHGTNELSSGSIWVLASTNLALPMNQWTSISTNPMPAGAFNLTVSNAVVSTLPHRFFRLQLFQIN